MLRKTKITLTGASDTKYSSTSVNGIIEYIKVTYTNGNVLGNVVITDEEEGIPILSLLGTATDFSGAVKKTIYNNTGGSVGTEYEKMPVTSRIKVVTSSHNANTQIDVVIWWSE